MTSAAMVEMDMVLPQLLAGCDVEKRYREECNGKGDHQQVSHGRMALLNAPSPRRGITTP
jgi:hypothetical protein